MSRVLLVEDSKAISDMVAELLRMDGHTVEVAENATEAVKILTWPPYDIVIVDVRLPGLDGLTLLKMLRLRKGWEDVPVVLMTASTTRETTGRLSKEAVGPVSYLQKPFGERDLQGVLKWAEGINATKRRTEAERGNGA